MEKKNNNSDAFAIVLKKDKKFHPITGNWIDADKSELSILLTKIKYKNNKFSFFEDGSEEIKDDKMYSNFLYTPPFGISSKILLELYNISDDIESLFTAIDENYEEYNIFTISRLINAWLVNTYKNPKDYIDQFIEILYKLIIKFPHPLINKIIKIKDSKLLKDIKKFSNIWLEDMPQNQINLLEDLFIYLKKKYL